MTWQPDASIETLRARASWLKRIRDFFESRGVLEVETPILAPTTIPDPNIESLSTTFQTHTYYLQTSPEFYMKRLLAAGTGAIYQLSRVFRDDECGRLHNPEFTLLEWYQPGYTQHDLMDEVTELLVTLLDNVDAVERITYQDLFLRHVKIDPLLESRSAIETFCSQQNLECPVVNEPWDIILDWLLSCVIQPQMRGTCFIYDYPASQAALAQIDKGNPDVARRFELYIDGVEIANGFEELIDSEEQRQRFNRENKQRYDQGQEQIPVDLNFLKALDEMPPTSGVALGLDRLLMIERKASRLSDCMAFAWQNVTD